MASRPRSRSPAGIEDSAPTSILRRRILLRRRRSRTPEVSAAWLHRDERHDRADIYGTSIPHIAGSRIMNASAAPATSRARLPVGLQCPAPPGRQGSGMSHGQPRRHPNTTPCDRDRAGARRPARPVAAAARRQISPGARIPTSARCLRIISTAPARQPRQAHAAPLAKPVLAPAHGRNRTAHARADSQLLDCASGGRDGVACDGDRIPDGGRRAAAQLFRGKRDAQHKPPRLARRYALAAWPAGDRPRRRTDPIDDALQLCPTTRIASTRPSRCPKVSRSGRQGTRDLEVLMQNPPSDADQFVVAPHDLAWVAYFSFSPTGYIQDDESLEADALLDSITEGTRHGNAERRKRGWDTLRVLGWSFEPKYDQQLNALEWAILAETEESRSRLVNYNTRLLGRRGVMEVTLVTDPELLDESVATFKGLMPGYEFAAGENYAEFKRRPCRRDRPSRSLRRRRCGRLQEGLFAAIASRAEVLEAACLAVVGVASGCAGCSCKTRSIAVMPDAASAGNGLVAFYVQDSAQLLYVDERGGRPRRGWRFRLGSLSSGTLPVCPEPAAATRAMFRANWLEADRRSRNRHRTVSIRATWGVGRCCTALCFLLLVALPAAISPTVQPSAGDPRRRIRGDRPDAGAACAEAPAPGPVGAGRRCARHRGAALPAPCHQPRAQGLPGPGPAW